MHVILASTSHYFSPCINQCLHHSLVLINKENIGLGERDGGVIVELWQKMVTKLEDLLPPPITVPKRRLESLVEKPLDAQRSSYIYHNLPDGISLYEDHCCGKDHFPTETLQELGVTVLHIKLHATMEIRRKHLAAVT